jgi:F0F1-type ATP synthase membrane subunit b/b'
VDRQLAEVESSVSKEREKMVEASKRQAGEVLLKAREDSGIVVSQAKEETAAKAEQVRQTLRAEIGSLVDIVAAKVLGRSI